MLDEAEVERPHGLIDGSAIKALDWSARLG